MTYRSGTGWRMQPAESVAVVTRKCWGCGVRYLASQGTWYDGVWVMSPEGHMLGWYGCDFCSNACMQRWRTYERKQIAREMTNGIVKCWLS